MLAALDKAKYFTTLGLKVVIDNEGYKEKKMLLPVREGVHEYNVRPFGLTNVSGIFQELMSIVLHGLKDFAMAYLDDIIVFCAQKNNINNILKKNLFA